MSAIDQLFSKNNADAIKKLWSDDKSSRLLIQKEIGKQLLSDETSEIFLDELPLTQLMLITSLSSFSNSEEECTNIASIIYWGMQRKDVLPMITEHNGKELAYRCLISLGFFKNALIRRWKRYAAPSPKFYRMIGIKSFGLLGMNDISIHFYQWENFLSEFFV